MKLLLTGVGGTGKSSVMRLLADRYGVGLITSPTRSFFATKGITSEIELRRAPPEVQREFQVSLTEHAIEWWVSHQGGKGVKVADRTLYDYLTYLIFLSPGIQLLDMESLRMRITQAMGQEEYLLFYFNYPTLFQWNPNDGFRSGEQGRNWILSAILQKLLWDGVEKPIEMPDSSVEERVEFIASIAGLVRVA